MASIRRRSSENRSVPSSSVWMTRSDHLSPMRSRICRVSRPSLVSLRNLCDTNDGRDTRQILDLIGDKWSLLVIHTLEEGTLRFSELRRLIEAISQRVLTRTLRQLER